MKRIIIFKEKHADRYFDASDEQKLAQACVRILKERNADGYWYYREYDKEEYSRSLSKEEREIINMTEEQVKALPDTLRKDFEMKRSRYARNKEAYAREKKLEDAWFAGLEKILSTDDEEAYKITTEGVDLGYRIPKPLAVALLDVRSDYQYEGYELVNLE